MYRIQEVAERVGVQSRGAEMASVDLDQAEDDEEVVVEGQAGQKPVEDASHLRAGKQNEVVLASYRRSIIYVTLIIRKYCNFCNYCLINQEFLPNPSRSESR